MRLGRLRARRMRAAALSVAAVSLLTGCVHISQLQFRVDHYVKFVAPESRAKLALPVTLRWQVSGFRVVGPGSEPASKDAGYFALFVDRAPIKPGQSLNAAVGDDQSCRTSAPVPARHCLTDHSVYLTTNLSYTLRRVEQLSGNNDAWQLHEVTIVLIDTADHRIGEHAYYRDFKLKRGVES